MMVAKGLVVVVVVVVLLLLVRLKKLRVAFSRLS